MVEEANQSNAVAKGSIVRFPNSPHRSVTSHKSFTSCLPFLVVALNLWLRSGICFQKVDVSTVNTSQQRTHVHIFYLLSLSSAS
jgi:hypothetical protein